MGWVVDSVGQVLARYLEKPAHGYEPFTPTKAGALRAVLRPGDVLLVEDNNHIFGVIKYLTQSTWSHAAVYCGPIGDRKTVHGEPLVLVEANIGPGVIAAALSKYARYNIRICRPTGLTPEDRARVCAYAAERIGFDYDLKNIIDLLRYLFPLPVPQRWRRRMMALGSCRSIRIIGSALIAQAFATVRYPILPKVTKLEKQSGSRRNPGDPPLFALCAARLRHPALLRGGQTDAIARLQLQIDELGRRAAHRTRRADRATTGANRWRRPGRNDGDGLTITLAARLARP